jgi:GNAT superfamily N-acetyltransferase
MHWGSRHVICCPRSERAAALKQLHDALPADQRSVFAQVLSAADPRDEDYWDGVLIATGGDTAGADRSVDAVVWVQLAAGNTAVVWAAPDDTDAGRELLKAAAEFIDRRGIPLAQMVVGEGDGYCDTVQARCGFPRFAGLAYLFAEVPRPAAWLAVGDSGEAGGEWDSDGLHFVSGAGEQPQRLAALLEATYDGTLDCPALDGVRPMNEVLDGYRAQGRYSPDDWYIVRENEVDIGALILAEHPGFGNWELVYMGVVPSARGHKCGSRIVRFALDTAARRGAERLVLAVDDANTPALQAYERAGFVQWDRRIVYARLRTRA